MPNLPFFTWKTKLFSQDQDTWFFSVSHWQVLTHTSYKWHVEKVVLLSGCIFTSMIITVTKIRDLLLTNLKGQEDRYGVQSKMAKDIFRFPLR